MHAWPGTYFTSQEIFDLERRRIFDRSWMCVGRSAAIPKAGSFLRVEVGRESVLVVRGKDGELRGLLNLCRHRGTRLCLDERGEFGQSIRCMYHGWTYDLDGRLVGAPYTRHSSEDKEERRLHPAAVTEWLGYVWVNLESAQHSLAEQVSPQLHARFGDDEVVARYGVEDLLVAHTIEYDVRANWKILFENFCECYHCPTIHPELCSLVPSFRSGYSSISDPTSQGARLSDHAAGFSLSGRTTAALLPGLSADDRRTFYAFVLWPNVAFVLVPDHVVCFRLEPQSPDRTRLVVEWLFHPQAAAEDGFDPHEAVELFDVTNRQDVDVCERVQLGASSGYFEQLQHPYEYPIDDFRRWVESALAGEAAT